MKKLMKCPKKKMRITKMVMPTTKITQMKISTMAASPHKPTDPEKTNILPQTNPKIKAVSMRLLSLIIPTFKK